MIEEIGKVRLDYSEYPGTDLYSDGEVENELLDIVKNRTPEEYAKVIEQRKSWPILYHLSPLRENIIDWLPWESMIPLESTASRNAGITGESTASRNARITGESAASRNAGITGESAASRNAGIAGESAVPWEAISPLESGISREVKVPGEAKLPGEGQVSREDAGAKEDLAPGETAGTGEAVTSDKATDNRKAESMVGARDTTENAASNPGTDKPANAVMEHSAVSQKIMGGSAEGAFAGGGQGLKVLEVGSGCGAITGAIARRAGSVTCVELSKKRSEINAWRHREHGNITIHVGNFKDIEPKLPGDYDLICLIGVFEYAMGYMGGETPYEDFLKILISHLAPEGRLLIAIENQYGLKYFAGCKEDHLGTYFSGIENYEAQKGVRTFSREGLERIFRNCGVGEWHFYYPYPDYKFMTTLYSDEFLPKKGELCNNLRNFDRDRMLLFDEKAAFDGIVEDGLYPVFANSYLAVLGKGFDTKYVKYSNDRAPEYAIRTEISSSLWHRQRLVSVRKYPQTPEAEEHVRGMAAAYESLTEKYRGGNLEINRCELEEEGERLCALFEFVPGIPLSELMDAGLEKNNLEGFYEYFRQYVERIGYNSDYPAADFDPVFSNILVEEAEEREGGEEGTGRGDRWTLIDYEWTFGRAIDTRELAFRAMYCYLLEDARRSKLKPERVLKELSITEETAEYYREQEREFQRFVTGERLAMSQIREAMGYRATVPQKWIDKYQDSELVNRVQIYEDKGSGYSEEASYFVENAYQGDNLIDMKLQVEKEVNALRIDPGLFPCVVKIKEMTFNGETVPLEKKKMLSANGRIVKPSGEDTEKYSPSIVFGTNDPNLSIAVRELARLSQNTLRVRMEIVRLPLNMAQDLAAKGTRWFGN